jgi:anion-transporting  ArsA/GET3 family ATPase
VDRVVVNAVVPFPFPPGLEDLDRRLARLAPDTPLGGLPRPGVLAACGRTLRERHELNQRYLKEIARCTGLPILELPYLMEGIGGPAELRRLGEALIGSPQAVAA